MGTKEAIIKKISSIDDENYLKHILNMLSAVEESEEVYRLSDAERKAVDEGLKDVAEGRVYSQSDVDELTKKWLKGK
jgi:predicted transcriptional regulator